MKLARLSNDPSTLLEFFQEGLEALGAVSERSWHDRLQVVAEGPAARLWNSDGSLLETEIYFPPPDDTSPRQADREVFAGCPLTFRLAEALRPPPVPLERGILQGGETPKPPAPEVAEKLWHAQIPGCSRWRVEGAFRSGWHFSLMSLARCEIQAIDQHWTLHRVAVSLPDGSRDESLVTSLDFAELTSQTAVPLDWPKPNWEAWNGCLRQAFAQELDPDLVAIRERQQRYLGRELDRIDSYFEAYNRELSERQRRSHSQTTRIKADERLSAAKAEHARRRQDQIRRHEIRVILHVDALLLLAETTWDATVGFVQRGEARSVQVSFVPRCRRWLVPL